jgi:hypothetical protein
MLNNRVHDVNSAAVLDGASNDPGCQHKNPTLPCDGYGGHGLYFDNQTGSTEAKNNLVYRVSDSAVNFPKAPACTFNGAVCTSTPNTVTNNIFAFARRSMLNDVSPYDSSTSPPPVPTFIATSNIFYFDRNPNSPELPFYVQGDCTFIAPGFTYRDYQQWDSNLYFRKGGGFDTDINAFHFQTTVGTGPSAPCININPTMDPLVWPPLSFAGWQGLGQDLQGTVTKDPGFANPSPVPSLLFPADDYSLPNGSPGVGFVVFDPTQAGRTNPVINPPAVPATFLTGTFSKVADF